MVLFLGALFSFAQPASAREGVNLVDSYGSVTRWNILHASPTPSYCNWESSDFGLLEFHATNADGSGNNGCLDPWFIHCDTDSLVARGAWPLVDATWSKGSHFEAILACTVTLTTRTGLVATRSVTGDLAIDEHELTLIHPDGTHVRIFTPGPGPDEAGLILDPGTYQILLEMYAFQTNPGGDFINSYEGEIILRWADPDLVAVESTSWGNLKAIYR
jgi:hypothetical protein